MKVGFTGTSKGTTYEQRVLVLTLLKSLQPSEFHHGDCEGADVDFHMICRTHFRSILINTHPCDLLEKRAFLEADKVFPAKPPLDRNKDIANCCDILLACPRQEKEILRSGTWATVRYARKAGKEIVIISPDGLEGRK